MTAQHDMTFILHLFGTCLQKTNRYCSTDYIRVIVVCSHHFADLYPQGRSIRIRFTSVLYLPMNLTQRLGPQSSIVDAPADLNRETCGAPSGSSSSTTFLRSSSKTCSTLRRRSLQFGTGRLDRKPRYVSRALWPLIYAEID